MNSTIVASIAVVAGSMLLANFKVVTYLIIGRPTLAKVDKSDPQVIFHVTKDAFYNLPDDSDYNLHMNNASFHKICDIKRTAHTHTVAPVAGLKLITMEYLLGQSASSARFLAEIPIFSTYFVYTRFLTWSPDGQQLYYQVVFTRKGRRRNRTIDTQVFKEVPSIIPEDEVICSILYVRNQISLPNGKKVLMEEIFKQEGYDTDDERVQKMRAEGWEYVKDLHAAWDKEMALKGTRHLGFRL